MAANLKFILEPVCYFMRNLIPRNNNEMIVGDFY